jgi:hypothetical protein
MTAINDLVGMACRLDSQGAKGLEPEFLQLAEAAEAFSSLYASIYEILGTLLSLELFRVEFRMPAAPPAQEPPGEEKAPVPMPKEAREVVVGPINVYAITKEVQEALDRLGKETLDVTAAYAKYIPQERLPVIAPAARIVESQGPVPPEKPELGRQYSEPKRTEIPPVQARRAIMPAERPQTYKHPIELKKSEVPRVEKVTRPPPVRPQRTDASREVPSQDKAPIIKAPLEMPAHGEIVDREIRRSVTVINGLREVYDVLLASAPAITGLEKEVRGFSLPEAVFGSGLKVPSQAEEIPAPSPAGGHTPLVQAPSSTAIPPQPSITIPVPMARPITPQVTPGTPIPQRPSTTTPAIPAKDATQAPGAASGKGRPVSPEAWPLAGKGEDEEVKLRVTYKNIEVPLIKPILKAPPTVEESAANARMISEAIAKSSAPIASAEPPPPAPAPVNKPTLEHGVQPGYEAMRRPVEVQAARALSAVYSTVYRTVNIMEGYTNLAASVSRAAGEAAESGVGPYAGTPITKLLYAAASPIALPASPFNLPLNTGQMPAFTPDAGGRIEATAPAINLVMGIAASRAMQSAGGSAINNFISIMPSLGSGGLQAAIPVERMGAGPINIHVPPASGERGQEPGAVNKVSNFHNTFNITVSMKGGGDEGDLRELGKKIGRILSDEIKRYGGI